MSESKEEFEKKLAHEAELEIKRIQLQQKEQFVKERKLDLEIERIQHTDKELSVVATTNFSLTTDEEIEQVQQEGEEYMRAAKNCMLFINKEFERMVPFFRKNLILIGGKTGEGKSTTVANIIATTISRVNKETGKRRRVLVITNEERREDVLNRVTCISKGWAYTNHDMFTEAQINTFKEYQKILMSGSLVKIIDDNYGSTKEFPISGVTTTLEGIQGIFDNLPKDDPFDVIVLDYYQNVKFSKKNPQLNEYQVQAAFAAMLDQYKNTYPAPIVVLAQVSPPDAEKKIPFKTRIEGRKVILNVCTCCMEMVADRDNLRTEWIIHKSRFNESIGRSFFTGFDGGRFVLYDEEFIKKVEEIQAYKQRDYLNKKIGHMPVVKEEENGK